MAAVTDVAFDFVYEVKEADICNRALHRLGAGRIRDTLENTKQANACREIYAITRDELLRLNEWAFASRSEYVREDVDYPYQKFDYSLAYIADDRIELAGAASTSSATITVPADFELDERFIGRTVEGTNVRPGSFVVAVDDALHTITLDRATTGVMANAAMYIPLLKVWRVNNDEDALFRSAGAMGEQRLFASVSSGAGSDGVSVLIMRYTRLVPDPAFFDVMFTDALALRIASKICVYMTHDYSLKSQIDSEFSSILSAASKASSQEKQVDAPASWWTDRGVQTQPTTARGQH